MRDLVRRCVDAGREAVGGERVEDLARDLLDWSRRNAQRLTELVRREVQRQLRLVGAATREEVSELRKRVRALERQVGSGGRKKPQAKKAQGRRPQAKKAAGKKTQGRAPRASSARKATGPGSRVPPE